ncbi:hypothetical protein CXG81DRAFT_16402 [Caulochytrium protostelioides]|uniref:Uncharacterized protein n=1 Tax=Caulochytrium protostelioides TaxID=1555241 RepID=A0A4P9XF03_9FUNG|nr:hypothetical protein CXG81DRAFT_16402 [Caulochytrium protostelioides]|eukprot:RKP04118.1 hypothetical protein CXG81DRAFT_16402 [Caulochytrium protostelioides]
MTLGERRAARWGTDHRRSHCDARVWSDAGGGGNGGPTTGGSVSSPLAAHRSPLAARLVLSRPTQRTPRPGGSGPRHRCHASGRRQPRGHGHGHGQAHRRPRRRATRDATSRQRDTWFRVPPRTVSGRAAPTRSVCCPPPPPAAAAAQRRRRRRRRPPRPAARGPPTPPSLRPATATRRARAGVATCEHVDPPRPPGRRPSFHRRPPPDLHRHPRALCLAWRRTLKLPSTAP